MRRMIRASSPATLLTALKGAKAGDIIGLAPGSYTLSLLNLRCPGEVVITSQSLETPAKITGLKVTGCSNLTFRGLEFAFPAVQSDAATNASGALVQGSDHIRFDHVKVHGSIGGKPGNDVVGITFKGCSDYGITSSDLSNLRVGVIQGNGQRAKFKGNDFHDIRIDGIDSSTMD